MTTKTIYEMTYSEMKELLGLDDIDNSAYDRYRKELINNLVDEVVSGTDNQRVKEIMTHVKNYKDAWELAYELVDDRTYHEIYVEIPDSQIVREYDGIDAPIEAARVEFAHNLADRRCATDAEILECFKS